MTTYLDEAPEGATFAKPSRLRRARDAAEADYYLGIASAVRALASSDHPDLLELEKRGVTIDGKGADRLHAALDLVGEEYARHERMPLDAARSIIHGAYLKGTQYGLVWTAVAQNRVTGYQARTIETRAERLAARTAVISETTRPDGTTELTADEGDRLLHGEAHTAALTLFLTGAIAWAEEGYAGGKLTYRLDKIIKNLTPGYEPVVIERRDDHTGVHLTPCDDGLNAHIAFVAPLDTCVRFKTFLTAAADASADHAERAGLDDPRTHGQREIDALVDLVDDALTRHIPATDPEAAAPAGATPSTPRRRTHRPLSSTQVHVHIDGTTLLGIDDNPCHVDGLGTVPAEIARALATATGAQWRALIAGPGTRHLLDVGAKSYAITAAMRRFITDRDRTCTAPGCTVPAIDCDLDHIVPYPEGPTTVGNLTAKCRGHHKHKTQFYYEDRKLRKIRETGSDEQWPGLPDEPPF